jgi:E3 ubiquitin-protein ligase TRIP12
METRSRKQREGTAHRESPATPAGLKRARHSFVAAVAATSSLTPSSTPTLSTPIIPTAAAAALLTGIAAVSVGGLDPPPPPPHPPPASLFTRFSTRTTTAAAAIAAAASVTSAARLPSETEMDFEGQGLASGSKRDHTKTRGKRGGGQPLKHPFDEGLGSEDSDRENEKGKEKEVEKERGRDRSDRERAVVAAAANGGDEDDDGEGGSPSNQNLASASSALHGLLRKLGAGFDDLLPSSIPSSNQNSRLRRILSGLRAEGEEGRQLESLSQLCELLSIGTEDSLSRFSVDLFVPVLVGLLSHEHNPDMMLLAARALTHLCDVLPSSCGAVVHYGAVPSLCARLLTIEYIDLAEQSLQALEKISHEHPTACLRAGALMAVLSYLDFFSTGVQRVAVSIAANICRQLPSDASDFVMEAVPLLTNLLQYQDSKVVEHASVCLTRIAEASATSSQKLDVLCSHGLIPQATRLISGSNVPGSLVPQTTLSSSTYTVLIRLLSICAGGSPAAAESLLQLQISSILQKVLAGSGLTSSTSASPRSVSRPPEQVIVSLLDLSLPIGLAWQA